MHQICHISKRTCLYLLESGIVPSIDSKKKTHRFKIKTVDVIEFLKKRDLCSDYYRVPAGYYATRKKSFAEILSADELKRIHLFFENLLFDYPDVMSTEEVALFTGYNKNTIAKWCNKDFLQHFFIQQKFRIPKEYLLNFLTSEYFFLITDKSQTHKSFIAQIAQLLSVQTQRDE